MIEKGSGHSEQVGFDFRKRRKRAVGVQKGVQKRVVGGRKHPG